MRFAWCERTTQAFYPKLHAQRLVRRADRLFTRPLRQRSQCTFEDLPTGTAEGTRTPLVRAPGL